MRECVCMNVCFCVCMHTLCLHVRACVHVYCMYTVCVCECVCMCELCMCTVCVPMCVCVVGPELTVWLTHFNYLGTKISNRAVV